MEVFQPRVNTESLRVALLTKKILEARGIKTDVAVSFYRVIALDHDNPQKDIRLLERFVLFVRTVARELESDFAVYLTPRGAHGLIMRKVDRDYWKRFYAVLLDSLERNERLAAIIDKAHVYMALRRGYVTLRLNQICRYIFCKFELRGERRVFKCERDMYCLERWLAHGQRD